MDPRENDQSLELPRLSADAQQMEATLRQFVPRPAGLDRERLMFLAGQASLSPAPASHIESASWFWPASTLAMSAVAACLAIMLGWQSSRELVERVAYVQQPISPTEVHEVVAAPSRPAIPTVAVALKQPASWLPALPADSVLQMRNVALRWGVDALPPAVATNSAGTEPTSGQLWQELREPPASEPADPSL